MSDSLTWWVGNRDPSITETLTYDDGTVVNLTGKTVKFKMRAVNSSVLKVDATATIVSALDGQVRYDWATPDVDTAGQFLVWWEVTTTATGKTQDMGEAVITFAPHTPETRAYVELEEYKSSAELTGTSHSDPDIRLALLAASRGLDLALGRRFYPDADANQVRYYTPERTDWVPIDDLITLTALASDPNGDATFSQSWVQNTDFVLEPLNAAADGWPWTSVRLHPRSTSLYFPSYPRSLRVTGKFGWATCPAAIKNATAIIAERLVKRTRESPFGIAQLGLDGAVMRATSIARDPDIALLIGPYSRNSGVA